MGDWDQTIDIEKGDESELDGDAESVDFLGTSPQTDLCGILERFDSTPEVVLVCRIGRVTFYRIPSKKGVWLCELDKE